MGRPLHHVTSGLSKSWYAVWTWQMNAQIFLSEDSVASPTRWTWVWVSSWSSWWTGKPVMLQSMRSQSQTWLSDRTTSTLAYENHAQNPSTYECTVYKGRKLRTGQGYLPLWNTGKEDNTMPWWSDGKPCLLTCCSPVNPRLSQLRLVAPPPARIPPPLEKKNREETVDSFVWYDKYLQFQRIIFPGNNNESEK